MEKKVVRTVYRGVEMPYATGVRVGNLVFLSGLAGVEPESGYVAIDPSFREEEHVKRQVEVIMKKIDTALKKLGASMNDIVKFQVFMRDMSHFPLIVETVKKFLPKTNPIEDICCTGWLSSPQAVIASPGLYVELEATAVIMEKK